MKKMKPISIFKETEYLEGKPREALTIILRTIGCYRARKGRGCFMCGFIRDCARRPVSVEELVSQLDFALEKIKEGMVIKLFTSGSFFDQSEVPKDACEEILKKLGEKRVKRVIVESRCEFVTEDALSRAKEFVPLDVAVGLESTNDEVREECIGKGMRFEEYLRVVKLTSKLNVGLKTYLLLKPPFLSEDEAIRDTITSINELMRLGIHTRISINICNVQAGTLVERLWKNGEYRPPWLWSALHILRYAKKTYPDLVVMSDPVGYGKNRGPHNCGECDQMVASAIKSFSETQDIRNLDDAFRVGCECLENWRQALRLDRKGYGTSLFT